MENTVLPPSHPLSIPEPADAWARQDRLSLARSHACGLLVNGNPEDELREAVGKTSRDLIGRALAGWREECRTLAEQPPEVLERFMAEHLAGFMRTTGGGWIPEQRQEFIDQTMIDFADLPFSVLEPAVRYARRKVYSPARFGSWVFESIEPTLIRLQVEGENLQKLMRIADDGR